MSGAAFGVALSVFLACAVEAVEALTIVLAMGTTEGWRPALRGAGAALLALAFVVGALGPALVAAPLAGVRVVVGTLLLLFGLQWLRKAILRFAGRKPARNEEEEYRQLCAKARESRGRGERLAFAVSFKGVLLEGLEVAVIVISFGANQHRLGLAAAAAAVALMVVVALGLALKAPLAKVPENGLKYGVGVLLSSFGSFWSSQGAGVHWPAGDGAILYLVATFALCGGLLVAFLRLGGSACEAEAMQR